MPDRSFFARMGRLSSIVAILPSSMAVGWIVGYYVLDRHLGSFPWGSLACTLVGAGAGFYEIFRILSAERQDTNDPPSDSD
jgi:F0F1-type ATP synthase assembly protein I